MKKLLPACLLTAALLNSCSLLQRSSPAPEQEGPEAPFAGEVNAVTPVADLTPSYEAEISRMSTKIAALETKVDVLTANLEKAQMRNAQPVIEGGARPSPRLAAPVEDLDDAAFEAAQVSAAPVRAAALPSESKVPDAPTSAVEKDFRAAMDLFQAGQNLEASSQFALFSKKNPRHLLASHALYWAGEAAARGQQWSLAVQNWQELEKTYPRSAYLPDALAGLARAYEKQGDIARAKGYKDTLLRTFPKSPVAISLNSPRGHEVGSVNQRVQFREEQEEVPTFEEEGSAPAGEAHE